MRVNKYRGICPVCRAPVAPNAGYLEKQFGRWKAIHVPCFDTAPGEESAIVVTRFAGGATVYQNRNGRCIDAPCCGCCS